MSCFHEHRYEECVKRNYKIKLLGENRDFVSCITQWVTEYNLEIDKSTVTKKFEKLSK